MSLTDDYFQPVTVKWFNAAIRAVWQNGFICRAAHFHKTMSPVTGGALMTASFPEITYIAFVRNQLERI